MKLIREFFSTKASEPVVDPSATTKRRGRGSKPSNPSDVKEALAPKKSLDLRKMEASASTSQTGTMASAEVQQAFMMAGRGGIPGSAEPEIVVEDEHARPTHLMPPRAVSAASLAQQRKSARDALYAADEQLARHRVAQGMAQIELTGEELEKAEATWQQEIEKSQASVATAQANLDRIRYQLDTLLPSPSHDEAASLERTDQNSDFTYVVRTPNAAPEKEKKPGLLAKLRRFGRSSKAVKPAEDAKPAPAAPVKIAPPKIKTPTQTMGPRPSSGTGAPEVLRPVAVPTMAAAASSSTGAPSELKSTAEAAKELIQMAEQAHQALTASMPRPPKLDRGSTHASDSDTEDPFEALSLSNLHWTLTANRALAQIGREKYHLRTIEGALQTVHSKREELHSQLPPKDRHVLIEVSQRHEAAAARRGELEQAFAVKQQERNELTEHLKTIDIRLSNAHHKRLSARQSRLDPVRNHEIEILETRRQKIAQVQNDILKWEKEIDAEDFWKSPPDQWHKDLAEERVRLSHAEERRDSDGPDQAAQPWADIAKNHEREVARLESRARRLDSLTIHLTASQRELIGNTSPHDRYVELTRHLDAEKSHQQELLNGRAALEARQEQIKMGSEDDRHRHLEQFQHKYQALSPLQRYKPRKWKAERGALKAQQDGLLGIRGHQNDAEIARALEAVEADVVRQDELLKQSEKTISDIKDSLDALIKSRQAIAPSGQYSKTDAILNIAPRPDHTRLPALEEQLAEMVVTSQILRGRLREGSASEIDHAALTTLELNIGELEQHIARLGAAQAQPRADLELFNSAFASGTGLRRPGRKGRRALKIVDIRAALAEEQKQLTSRLRSLKQEAEQDARGPRLIELQMELRRLHSAITNIEADEGIRAEDELQSRIVGLWEDSQKVADNPLDTRELEHQLTELKDRNQPLRDGLERLKQELRNTQSELDSLPAPLEPKATPGAEVVIDQAAAQAALSKLPQLEQRWHRTQHHLDEALQALSAAMPAPGTPAADEPLDRAGQVEALQGWVTAANTARLASSLLESARKTAAPLIAADEPDDQERDAEEEITQLELHVQEVRKLISEGDAEASTLKSQLEQAQTELEITEQEQSAEQTAAGDRLISNEKARRQLDRQMRPLADAAKQIQALGREAESVKKGETRLQQARARQQRATIALIHDMIDTPPGFKSQRASAELNQQLASVANRLAIREEIAADSLPRDLALQIVCLASALPAPDMVAAETALRTLQTTPLPLLIPKPDGSGQAPQLAKADLELAHQLAHRLLDQPRGAEILDALLTGDSSNASLVLKEATRVFLAAGAALTRGDGTNEDRQFLENARAGALHVVHHEGALPEAHDQLVAYRALSQNLIANGPASDFRRAENVLQETPAEMLRQALVTALQESGQDVGQQPSIPQQRVETGTLSQAAAAARDAAMALGYKPEDALSKLAAALQSSRKAGQDQPPPLAQRLLHGLIEAVLEPWNHHLQTHEISTTGQPAPGSPRQGYVAPWLENGAPRRNAGPPEQPQYTPATRVGADFFEAVERKVRPEEIQSDTALAALWAQLKTIPQPMVAVAQMMAHASQIMAPEQGGLNSPLQGAVTQALKSFHLVEHPEHAPPALLDAYAKSVVSGAIQPPPPRYEIRATTDAVRNTNWLELAISPHEVAVSFGDSKTIVSDPARRLAQQPSGSGQGLRTPQAAAQPETTVTVQIAQSPNQDSSVQQAAVGLVSDMLDWRVLRRADNQPYGNALEALLTRHPHAAVKVRTEVQHPVTARANTENTTILTTENGIVAPLRSRQVVTYDDVSAFHQAVQEKRHELVNHAVEHRPAITQTAEQYHLARVELIEELLDDSLKRSQISGAPKQSFSLVSTLRPEVAPVVDGLSACRHLSMMANGAHNKSSRGADSAQLKIDQLLADPSSWILHTLEGKWGKAGEA